MSAADPAWGSAPDTVTAREGEVHVWSAPLDPPGEAVRRYGALLAPDERARAGRFHFERDRRRFTVARGVLRSMLGRYLGLDPRRVEFRYESHGKPALAGEPAAGGLRFNVSHSGEMALYAVAAGRELGVDVEEVRPMEDGLQIAERFFSAAEVAAFRALPAEIRDDAFFNCWTRKEAFIKAVGEGLSFPLHVFDVTLAPGEPARLLASRDPNQAERWSLRGLPDPAPGYRAAVVVEGDGWGLACWRWEEPATR
ncbi:MAG TPA: 4'-phosphopantetheinyl transferase superfamily protein [Longimicrobiaceae bacterium]|nr:4'-phosphopantetheinyl transferase superfamily protein [Longimicrobiaceae bacterium]